MTNRTPGPEQRIPDGCPICRELHEPRGLSFDGKGINACGMYRTRLATFTKNAPEHLGPLFAAAPETKGQRDELLAALARLSRAAANRENTMGDPMRLIEVQAELRDATAVARAAIAKAEIQS